MGRHDEIRRLKAVVVRAHRRESDRDINLRTISRSCGLHGRPHPAPAPALDYDPATGISSIRHEAVVQFESIGEPPACAYVSARAPATAVVCPEGRGAIMGACDGGVKGALLVSGGDTGWICPKLEPGRKGAVSASAMCCKYGRRS